MYIRCEFTGSFPIRVKCLALVCIKCVPIMCYITHGVLRVGCVSAGTQEPSQWRL